MRRGFVVALILTILFGGAYFWYYTHELMPCRVPVRYSIGSIDERFGVSHEQVRTALAAAEQLWEDVSTQELFIYDETSPFAVTLRYDERQGATDQGEIARLTLEDKQHMGEEIRTQYEESVAQYEKQKTAYEADAATYEKKLAAHNAEVAKWNERGGAPERVYAELAREQEALSRENAVLMERARELNQLVATVNALGEQGNKAVADYNENVAWYNQFFGSEREFTQGEYTGDGIIIYQFSTDGELRRVLAHEMGHALSLEHVEGERSVMHYLLEGKGADFALSLEDVTEFTRVCEERPPFWEPMLRFMQSLVT